MKGKGDIRTGHPADIVRVSVHVEGQLGGSERLM